MKWASEIDIKGLNENISAKWANDLHVKGMIANRRVKHPRVLHSCKCYFDYFRTLLWLSRESLLLTLELFLLRGVYLAH